MGGFPFRMRWLLHNKGGTHMDQKTTITDIRIPFGRMVMIILKWMLASIPAAILLWLIVASMTLIFGVGIGGCAALVAQ